jgi:chromosome segregation ATPase
MEIVQPKHGFYPTSYMNENGSIASDSPSEFSEKDNGINPNLRELMEQSFKDKYEIMKRAYEERIVQMSAVIQETCSSLLTDEIINKMKSDPTSQGFIPAHINELLNTHVHGERERYLHDLVQRCGSLEASNRQNSDKVQVQERKIRHLESDVSKGRKAEVALDALFSKFGELEGKHEELSNSSAYTIGQLEMRIQDMDKEKENLLSNNDNLNGLVVEKGLEIEGLKISNEAHLKEVRALQDLCDQQTRDMAVIEDLDREEQQIKMAMKDSLQAKTSENTRLSDENHDLKQKIKYNEEDIDRLEEALRVSENGVAESKGKMQALMKQVEGMLAQEAQESNAAIAIVHEKMVNLRHKLSTEISKEKRFSAAQSEELEQLRNFKEEKSREIRIFQEDEAMLREKLGREQQRVHELQLQLQDQHNEATNARKAMEDAEFRSRQSLDMMKIVEERLTENEKKFGEELSLAEQRVRVENARDMNESRDQLDWKTQSMRLHYQNELGAMQNQLRHSYGGKPTNFPAAIYPGMGGVPPPPPAAAAAAAMHALAGGGAPGAGGIEAAVSSIQTEAVLKQAKEHWHKEKALLESAAANHLVQIEALEAEVATLKRSSDSAKDHMEEAVETKAKQLEVKMKELARKSDKQLSAVKSNLAEAVKENEMMKQVLGEKRHLVDDLQEQLSAAQHELGEHAKELAHHQKEHHHHKAQYHNVLQTHHEFVREAKSAHSLVVDELEETRRTHAELIAQHEQFGSDLAHHQKEHHNHKSQYKNVLQSHHDYVREAKNAHASLAEELDETRRAHAELIAQHNDGQQELSALRHKHDNLKQRTDQLEEEKAKFALTHGDWKQKHMELESALQEETRSHNATKDSLNQVSISLQKKHEELGSESHQLRAEQRALRDEAKKLEFSHMNAVQLILALREFYHDMEGFAVGLEDKLALGGVKLTPEEMKAKPHIHHHIHHGKSLSKAIEDILAANGMHVNFAAHHRKVHDKGSHHHHHHHHHSGGGGHHHSKHGGEDGKSEGGDAAGSVPGASVVTVDGRSAMELAEALSGAIARCRDLEGAKRDLEDELEHTKAQAISDHEQDGHMIATMKAQFDALMANYEQQQLVETAVEQGQGQDGSEGSLATHSSRHHHHHHHSSKHHHHSSKHHHSSDSVQGISDGASSAAPAQGAAADATNNESMLALPPSVPESAAQPQSVATVQSGEEGDEVKTIGSSSHHHHHSSKHHHHHHHSSKGSSEHQVVATTRSRSGSSALGLVATGDAAADAAALEEARMALEAAEQQARELNESLAASAAEAARKDKELAALREKVNATPLLALPAPGDESAAPVIIAENEEALHLELRKAKQELESTKNALVRMSEERDAAPPVIPLGPTTAQINEAGTGALVLLSADSGAAEPVTVQRGADGVNTVTDPNGARVAAFESLAKGLLDGLVSSTVLQATKAAALVEETNRTEQASAMLSSKAQSMVTSAMAPFTGSHADSLKAHAKVEALRDELAQCKRALSDSVNKGGSSSGAAVPPLTPAAGAGGNNRNFDESMSMDGGHSDTTSQAGHISKAARELMAGELEQSKQENHLLLELTKLEGDARVKTLISKLKATKKAATAALERVQQEKSEALRLSDAKHAAELDIVREEIESLKSTISAQADSLAEQSVARSSTLDSKLQLERAKRKDLIREFEKIDQEHRITIEELENLNLQLEQRCERAELQVTKLRMDAIGKDSSELGAFESGAHMTTEDNIIMRMFSPPTKGGKGRTPNSKNKGVP